MTLLADVRLGAQRPRWAKLPPRAVSSAGSEAVDLAASAGLILDDWQAWWLEQALSEAPDGNWAARENVLICGRQSGKNVILAAMELAALDLLAEPLIIHSAHEVPTALNHFQFMLGVIQGTPDLERKIQRVSYTNGRESIEFRNGSLLQFRARGKNSGRGLTAHRIVFDEAFRIPPESMGAMVPTLRAVPNVQIVYASSAPKADSTVLHSLIRRGRADDPDDRLFYAEWGNPKGTAMDDVEAWYQANPALGLGRVTEEALHDEYRTLVAGGDVELIAEFSREAVGIAEDPIGTARDPKIAPSAWSACPRRSSAPAGRIVVGWDVDIDGSSASIAVAGGNIGDPYVELVEHRNGVGWLAGRLVELVERHDPIAVGFNNAGPSAAQASAVLEAFKAAGISADVLAPLGTSDYAAACGGLFVDIAEGRLTVADVKPGPLDLAVGDVSDRRVGEGWAWDRRSATVPISPLVAVTVARALLPTEAPAEKHVYAY